MPDAPLQGVGVLVTRPRPQATDLVEAIESRGGSAYCFPVLEIVPFDELDIRNSLSRLGKPDIVIFVSRNAVEHGIAYTDGGAIAVIGPATAAAVAAAGRVVDIQPGDGYDSEHLLAEDRLQDVAGKCIRIIRGRSGRELLADELKKRGATVEYLSVYERRLPTVGAETAADLEARQHELRRLLDDLLDGVDVTGQTGARGDQQRHETGDVGAGHAGAALVAVAAAGHGAVDVAAGRGDLGLDRQVGVIPDGLTRRR